MIVQITSGVRRFKVRAKDERDAIRQAIEVAGGRGYRLELWWMHADELAGKPPDKVVEQTAFDFGG